MGLKLEGLSLSKGQLEQQSAQGYVSMVQTNGMNYQQMLAFKKHVIESIATAKKQAVVTVEKWLNKIVKTYLADADLQGYSLPKSESKNAEAMGKLRAELSSISDADLQAQIEASAKAGDFKKASRLATEKQKREKQATNAVKKNESKATTELKAMLKKWVGSLDSTELATLVAVKHNFVEFTKLAKSTK
jgi:BMFP domain-containing protein YqiC